MPMGLMDHGLYYGKSSMRVGLDLETGERAHTRG